MKQIMISFFRHIVRSSAILFLLGNVVANAADLPLPMAKDFQADARLVRKNRTPILVFFESASCPYCHVVEDDYLRPMFNSGDYRDKLVFRVVRIEDGARLHDFNGAAIDAATFAKHYGVSLTPHVKFLGADGQELVPGLLGLMTRDFYAGYLEDAINDALAKLRGPAEASSGHSAPKPL